MKRTGMSIGMIIKYFLMYFVIEMAMIFYYSAKNFAGGNLLTKTLIAVIYVGVVLLAVFEQQIFGILFLTICIVKMIMAIYVTIDNCFEY